MSRRPDNENHGPFYDADFARQHVKKGRLVPADGLCSSCRMPPPADWCWSHNPTCPLHMPLRGAAAITVRCEFGMLGAPAQSGVMVFRHGSNFAEFVSDDGKTRQFIRLDVLGASFTEDALS